MKLWQPYPVTVWCGRREVSGWCSKLSSDHEISGPGRTSYGEVIRDCRVLNTAQAFAPDKVREFIVALCEPEVAGATH